MPRVAASGNSPNWDRLYETAAAQAGYVSLTEALGAGYSRQLVRHYVREGRLERVDRGVYRLVHFPAGEHEDLVPLWLWSKQAGVFSHETALMLHELSDALPAKRHITLPAAWTSRRLRVPQGVLLHFAALPKKATGWVGPVPVTTPLRTITDCLLDEAPQELVRQAIRQGTRRGLFERGDLDAALRAARSSRDPDASTHR